MPTIHDQFSDAVSDVDVDLHDLAMTSRREGLARRRLRVSLTTAGVAASVAAVAGVAALSGVFAPGGVDEPAEVLTATAPEAPGAEAPEGALEPDPTSERTVRLTGTLGAAILLSHVEELLGAQVTSSGLRGQGGTGFVNEGSATLAADDLPDTFSEATFSTSAARSTLGVNVQLMPGYTPACTASDEQPTCDVTTLDDGRILLTHTEDGAKPGRTGVVAEVFDPTDGTRVAAHSSTTDGDTPLFDTTQLTEIVTSDDWAFEVPASWADAASALDVTLLS